MGHSAAKIHAIAAQRSNEPWLCIAGPPRHRHARHSGHGARYRAATMAYIASPPYAPSVHDPHHRGAGEACVVGPLWHASPAPPQLRTLAARAAWQCGAAMACVVAPLCAAPRAAMRGATILAIATTMRAIAAPRRHVSWRRCGVAVARATALPKRTLAAPRCTSPRSRDAAHRGAARVCNLAGATMRAITAPRHTPCPCRDGADRGSCGAYGSTAMARLRWHA